MYVCVCLYVCICMYVCVYRSSRPRSAIILGECLRNVCMYTYTNIHIYTHTYTYTRTCIHTYTYTHTPIHFVFAVEMSRISDMLKARGLTKLSKEAFAKVYECMSV